MRRELALVGMLVLAVLATAQGRSAGADGGPVRAVAVAGPRRLSGVPHDVAVALGLPRIAADGARLRLVVRNRGRRAERGVRVALWCDTDDDAPLWTTTVRIPSGGSLAWRLLVDVPDGATRLRAVVRLAGGADDAPEDNESVRWLTSVAGDPARGRIDWTSRCASCHGDDGRGGSVAEDVSSATAARILAAAWDGADGMPRFPSTTWSEAIDLAAHLRHPPPVVEPSPEPDPPPAPEPCPDAPSPDDVGPPPTWVNRIAAVVAGNCLRCHSGPAANRDHRFDTYEEVYADAPLMLTMIEAGAMPADGPMPIADRKAFEAWIAAGRPR